MTRTEKKIAVVLIHGIGDQEPLATLRSFVTAVLSPSGTAEGKPLFWSKPDAISGSFDLRRFQSVGRNSGGVRRPPIDFYEYYWAHRMEGTALEHVLRWIETLLLRSPASVPLELRRYWFFVWSVIAAVGLSLMIWRDWWKIVGVSLTIAVIIFVARSTAHVLARDWVGDAARYFSPKPGNIKVRDEIRRGLVDLLKGLHDSGVYKRVIIVGHSLGSAIAVDGLYHYWTLARQIDARPQEPRGDAVAAFEKYLKTPQPIHPAKVRELQKAVWHELRANGVPWRVTDLVTLGSPLAHYPFLAGLTERSYRERVQQREYSACPPVLDGKGIAHWSRYDTPVGRRSIAELHHAACFAATRWTNLYFPVSGLFGGDPVGGPLAPWFGSGITDRAVSTRHWGGRLNHLDYWRDDERDAECAARPLATLLDSLRFEEKTEITRG